MERNDCLEPRRVDMAVIVCSQCRKEFEDEFLCCPHCGTAQIPQLSKAELRLAHMKASQGPLGAVYLGFAVGLLIGVGAFTIAAIQGMGSFGLALSIPAFGVCGSGAGFLYHRFFHERRR